MKRLLLSVVICAFAFPAICQSSFSPDTYIEWNEFYSLQWPDFKGAQMEGYVGDAGTVVEIKAKPYVLKRVMYYDVFVLFNKEKSWANDQTESLLAHEQLHFDIAELYARKIRKRISQWGSLDESKLKEYNAEIRRLLEESNEVDKQYDIETLHGMLSDKQKMWEAKVKAELELLKDYRKPKRVITVNQ